MLAENHIPDIWLLQKVLRYEPASGKLFWRRQGLDDFKDTPHRSASHEHSRWNGRHADKEAFTATAPDGSKRGSFFGQFILAHKVIWAIQTGEWKAGRVKHKNGDRSCNSWDNLA